MKRDLNDYIKKSHIKLVEEFNAELEEFRKETETTAATLYEDAYTSFTLADVKVQDGKLVYTYDGKVESETIVRYDDDEQCYYEEDLDGITEWVKFWKACLRRARRYWTMDVDTLDAIQNGDKEDNENDDNE